MSTYKLTRILKDQNALVMPIHGAGEGTSILTDNKQCDVHAQVSDTLHEPEAYEHFICACERSTERRNDEQNYGDYQSLLSAKPT